MRCWWCGVEPESLVDVTTYGDPEPQYMANWPGGADHQHAERRPTPGQLESAGHEALMRIQNAAS